MRRRCTALLTLCMLFGLIAIPVVLTWREVRQEQLNHALIAAVDHNDAAGVRRWLRQGADPNAQVHTDDKRSLWKQVWDRLRGRHIQTKAVPMSALVAAIEWSYDNDVDKADTVQALVDAGAEVNIRFTHVISHPMLPEAIRFHTTPLVEAARYGKWRTVQVLLSHHADVNAADDDIGATCLMYAAINEQVGTVKALLSQGARINAQDRQGDTALFWMFSETMTYGDAIDLVRVRTFGGPTQKMRTLVAYLLQHGASVQKRADRGHTILFLARNAWHDPQLVRMLKQAAAKESGKHW
jgi:hypothetical protein